MRRPSFPSAVVVLAAVLAGSGAPPAAAQDAVPGEIVVAFEPDAAGARRAAVRQAAGVEAVRALRLPGAQLVRAESAGGVDDAIRALEARADVRYAEPNHVYRATALSNDPRLGELWGLRNTGQSVLGVSGTPGADANVTTAWDRFTGDQETLVAVADTGVAYDHPDLAANAWANRRETTGNGIDDDRNGFVDDVRGWDFIDGDADPRDLQGHGTHVAGTIAAAGGNGVGVVGVAQRARIMPVRVLDADGSGSLAAIAEGFDYAGDMGARVVNASLGGPGSSKALRDAITSHPATLFVVAAGNEGADVDGSHASFPCEEPAANVVCVAATDQRDGLAAFSNRGATSVDLGAPGVSVLSTVPARETVFADGFETDLAGRWLTSGAWGRTQERRSRGAWSLADSPGAQYAPSSSTFARSGVIDLRGRTGCSLSARVAYQTEATASGPVDRLRVQVSRDAWSTARTLETLGGSSGGAFQRVERHLHGDGALVQVGFALETNATVADDGVWIDEVEVACNAPGGDYGYSNGTSMATPHVAGAAALLAGARPAATVAELRGWLLSTGRPVTALTGRTVTGRRLDAGAALAAALATPEPRPAAEPVVVTGAAAGLSAVAATLQGTVDARGTTTRFEFEYGPTTDYGAVAPAGEGAGDGPLPVSAAVNGLAPGTAYHFRLVAVRGGRRTAGADAVFATPASVPPAAPPVAPAAPAPPAEAAAGDGGAEDPFEDSEWIEDEDFEDEPVVTPPPSRPAARAVPVRCAAVRRGSRPVRVRCRLAGAARAARASVRLTRGGRVVARASGRVARGGRLPDLTARRLRRGGHRVTVVLRPARGTGRTVAAAVKL